MMRSIEGPAVPTTQIPEPRRSVRMPSFDREPVARRRPVEAPAEWREEPPAEMPMERNARTQPPRAKEREEMGLFRNRRKAEAAPRQADRSKAITVMYYPDTDKYNRRKCIFHGEPAVTVCPNCGTLFCMECIKIDECPRCHTPLSFVDGSKEEVDDSDVIETEAQRLAIQKRWAQKRLADADKTSSRPKARSGPTTRDAMSERAMKIAEKVMVPDRPSEPTIQTFQSAPVERKVPMPVEQPAPRSAEQPAPAVKKKGASSLVAAALAHKSEEQKVSQQDDEPVPEEIIPAEKERDKEKDKLEKLRELLDQPDDEEGGANRDLSRL